MKRVWSLAGVALAVSLAILAGTLYAAKGNPPQKATFTGVVTDSMCGAKHMESGDDAKCTRTCVKGGAHYALLAGDKVYQLNGSSDDLDKLAGATVNITGALSSEGVIEVASVQPASAGASTKTNDPEPTAPSVTIEGLVRDVACPIQNKNATARSFNMKCALDCARLGSPLIILTDDGTIYTPISTSMPDQDQRSRLMPFVGKYVQVRGQVFERQGTHAIAMEQITELKGVHLETEAQ